MISLQLSRIFDEMALMLEYKEENFFKINAYRQAARILRNIKDLERFISEDRLEELPGIGKNLREKILEFYRTGRIAEYEKLKGEIPLIIFDLLKIPGIGVKTAKQIYETYRPDTLDEVESLAKAHKLKEIPGIGSKTEQQILVGIASAREWQEKITISLYSRNQTEILEFIKSLPGVEKVSSTGSLRLKEEIIPYYHFLIIFNGSKEKFTELMENFGFKLLDQNDGLLFLAPEGYKVKIDFATFNSWGNKLFLTTGPESFVKAIGVLDKSFSDEEMIFQSIGLPYVEPELRTAEGLLEFLKEADTDDLITASDIKGDLHVHSQHSDGINSIKDLALAAQKLGYEYISINDHSKSLTVAKGLDEERLLAQIAEIEALNRELEGITVLKGIEVDILKDGSLDLPDKLLAQLDVVVASVHTGFKLPKEEQTARIIEAIKNEHVDIIGHPTGRLLGRREQYDVDVEEIIAQAAKYSTALEINSSPERLDLNDEYVSHARREGVLIAINTDAHDTNRLANDLQFGVTVARKALLTKKDVLNAKDLKSLKKFLRRK
ncbi:DNA polymerase/3'-5' exonuclease PolX [Carboxydothermus ferrireducens]|uniref:DNA polymerase (Family 10) n=1 Tax=Carboxydothermus ferrireducens DSM 11255 TaxID=1119529 RepID=A0ABX2RAY4_9THEO|nr:DNA polymerase/3'-5' exonuclease PolX [Carboxydothermus ferrireducens]NYE58334.1 DNA polymerase (family 10) [Carboxydothermus ferrireducens DSM 11255]